MIRAGRKPCRPRYSSRREDWPSALAHLPASNPAIAWAIWPRTRLGLENKNRNSNYNPRRLDIKKNDCHRAGVVFRRSERTGHRDRKSVVECKMVSVRVDLGGRSNKKK